MVEAAPERDREPYKGRAHGVRPRGDKSSSPLETVHVDEEVKQDVFLDFCTKTSCVSQ